jgi:zinc and cadmium transporter
MDTLLYILGATILVSVLSLIGIVLLLLKRKLDRLLLILVSFAVGGLLGDAFIHMLPESLSLGANVFIYTIGGIMLFFIIERFLSWHHCHNECKEHTFTYLILIGDAVHNFIDGMIIAVSFLASIPIGIASTLAIIFHEIPQEFGDFAMLLYGKFSKMKALFFNFLSALTAIAGAVLTYFFSTNIQGLTNFLLPFAAGGFIYIAMSDMIPQLHKEGKLSNSIIQFASILIGIGLMFLLKILFI